MEQDGRLAIAALMWGSRNRIKSTATASVSPSPKAAATGGRKAAMDGTRCYRGQQNAHHQRQQNRREQGLRRFMVNPVATIAG